MSSPIPGLTYYADKKGFPRARGRKELPNAPKGFLPGWGYPTWQDEFDGFSLDTSKWNVRDRSEFGLLFDAAEPNASQVSVANSCLKIKGEWLTTPYPKNNSDSVSVITHKTGYVDHRLLKPGDYNHTQRYGRWEMRAKVPTGPNTRGALAAFWLRAQGPGGIGEIDIMESWGFGGNPPLEQGQWPGTSTLTIHSNTNGSGATSPAYQKVFWRPHELLGRKWPPGMTSYGPMSKNPPLDPVYNGFHVWGFEYYPNRLKADFDGETYLDLTPTDPDPVNGGNISWLWSPESFAQPFHVRINLHIGPSAKWWGIPLVEDQAQTQTLEYLIDYVRLYAWE